MDINTIIMMPTEYSLPLTGLDWLEYYSKHNVYHPGVDFNKGSGMDDYGQDIFAPANGKVIYAHNNESTSAGFGLFLIVKFEDGVYGRFAHNKENFVKQGDSFAKGQRIATMGNSGTVWSHLHNEYFNEAMAVMQKKHTKWGIPRVWRFYPSGKSKQWIQQYYYNPWEYLAKHDYTPLMPDIWSGTRPDDSTTRRETDIFFANFYNEYFE